MNKYKVLVAFELDGTSYEVDQVIELSAEAAATLVSEGKLALEPAGESQAE